MTKFESNVKTIPFSQEMVYEQLSNLQNIEKVKNIIPEDKIKSLTFDEENLSVEVSPIGKIAIRIIEKEPFKTIKFESVDSPMTFNIWIQLLPTGENSCKLKVTIGAELNFFMKKMVEKPLKEGVEKIADALSMLPYDK